MKPARMLGFAMAAIGAAGGLVAGLPVPPASPQPAAPPAGVVRVVTLRVVADEMYRAKPGWEPVLRRTVATVSDVYERQFQIRLVVQDVVPWTIGPSVPMRRILDRLRREVSIGSADVLVAFAAERCERLQYGVAQVFDRFAVVQTNCLDTAVLSNATPEAVLAHEIAHLFGAFHPAVGVDSVMRGGPPDRFDGQNTRVIRMMREFDFRRGVRGLDPAARRAWSAIYAEGHARGEPNPLASAVANAGWDLIGTGKGDEGEALLQEAAAMDPTGARVHTMLGVLYSQQGRLPDALRELETAKRLDFGEADARTELGFVLLRLGREDEALVELREVLRVDRQAARAYVGVGMILARRDRMPEAIGAFTNAIKVDARNGPAHLRLAEALDRVDRPAEAWAEAEQAHGLGEYVPTAFWQRLTERVPAAPRFPPTCTGPPGPAIDLENPDPAYREYVGRVRDRIRARQAYPRAARERRAQGEVQIEFQLGRDGRLDCLALRRSSGSEILDRYTMDAIRLAQPFPAMPPQIPQPSLVVSGTFRYQIAGVPNMR